MGWDSGRSSVRGFRGRRHCAHRNIVGAALALTAAAVVVPTTARAAGADAALDKLSPELRTLLRARHGSAAETSALHALGGAALVHPLSSRAPYASTDASSAAPPTLRLLVRTSSWLGLRSSRTRLQAAGARLGRALPSVNTAVVEATPDQIAALSQDRSVLSISPDRPMSAAADLDVNPASVGVPEAQNLTASASLSAGGGLDGRGVGVAVLDSGVAPVADIARHLAAFEDFVNGGPEGAAYDDYGHGTHVAGIVAGDGASSSGPNATRTYRGIAPGASLISAKVLDGQGRGTVSAAIAAIDWCIAHKDAYNIRVINLSLGAAVRESYRTDPLCQAAEQAVAAGIVVVTAAGNNQLYGSICAPGNDPAVITVGASNIHGTAARGDDTISTYTSRGPSLVDVTMKPDLIAPGSHVVSLRAPGAWIDTNHPETNVPTSEYEASPAGDTAYARISGTSMAAPAVAGAAALLLQANPQLTPSGVKAALMLSAQLLAGTDPLTGRSGLYDPLTQGAGELNLPGAVTLAARMRPTAGLTGSAAPTFTSTIAGQAFPWSLVTLPRFWTRTDGAVAPLLTRRSAWGSAALWGAGPTWSDTLIWGGPLSFTSQNGVTVAQNVAWGGGDAPSLCLDANNVAWGGGDYTGANNVAWGGGDYIGASNVAWGGGDITQVPLTVADNVAWGGGDAPFLSANNVAWGGGDYTGGTNVAWGGGDITEVPSTSISTSASNVAWGGGD